MLKKIVVGILLIVVSIFIVTYTSYTEYRDERMSELTSNSQIANSSLGAIEYNITGDSGPVVLFLHGTPGGYDQTTPIEGARVLAPSRPGYLRTAIELGRSPEEQAEVYIALLDELEIDKAIVMGVSGGGPSAISFASSYPNRTIALILLEAVSHSISIDGIKQPPFFMNYDLSLWAALSLMGQFMAPEQIVAQLVPNPENRRLIVENKKSLNEVTQLLWSMWPVSERVVGMQNDFMQFADLDLPNDNIVVPTLIVHGTADDNVPYAQSKKLAQKIPHARFYSIDGGDHFMPFSHQDELSMVIDEFIETLNITET